MLPRGKITDFGDLVFEERWLVKGRHLRLLWRVGPMRPTHPTAAARGRRPGTAPTRAVHTVTTDPEVDVIVDLQADKKVTLSVSWTDEVGNPTTAPTDATVTFTVDDDAVIDLTDNSDGTAVAAATGALGQATVHAEARGANVPVVTGDLLIVVVSGDANRLAITAGPPEEVTPDEAPTPTP